MQVAFVADAGQVTDRFVEDLSTDSACICTLQGTVNLSDQHAEAEQLARDEAGTTPEDLVANEPSFLAAPILGPGRCRVDEPNHPRAR